MARIACMQLAPRVGELGPNCELSIRGVREAVEAGADVVVLPELVTSGYMFSGPQEAGSMAITADHEVFGYWGDAAGPGRVVIGGFCEEGEDGLLYERPAGGRPPEVVVAMAAARINRVFIACADRTGVERGQEWTAGTAVINSSGWVVATPGGSGAAIADVELAEARAKAWTEL